MAGNTPNPIDTLRPGRTLISFGNRVLVEDERGHTVECTPRKKAGRVICGDRVRWRAGSPGKGVIEQIEPRSTLLERHDRSGRAKPMAANIDQIFIVCAPRPAFSEALIDRYLVASGLVGARAIILFNKQDLLGPARRTEIESRLAAYPSAGFPIIWIDTLTDGGLEPLLQQLAGSTSILVGQSGVGKSSILSRLLPEASIRIGALSDATELGRHTTTETTLYHIASGTDLIDSPGVRDFQLWHVEPAQAIAGYAEFKDLASHCRFHNCQHINEPGCAVEAAVREGQVDEGRLQRYRKLYEELKNHADRRSPY